MYQSQQYLEIGGKYIVSPFGESETLHGVNLYKLLCNLHDSGTKKPADFKLVLMSAIECQIGLDDMDKVEAIFDRVMGELDTLGAVAQKMSRLS